MPTLRIVELVERAESDGVFVSPPNNVAWFRRVTVLFTWYVGYLPSCASRSRLTRVGRPEGKAACYPEALADPFLEFDGVRRALERDGDSGESNGRVARL